MESRILVILFDRIVAEDQSVHRFRIQDRSIECFELIILDHDIAMEILFLVFQVGYFGIDRDNCIRKLEHIGQCIDELVVADQHIVAGSCFEPAVTVTAQQDSRTGGMVEDVVFHHRLFRCAEQGTAGTVVADQIVGKINFRCPFQILDTECSGFADCRVDTFFKNDLKLLYAVCSRFVHRFDRSDFVGITDNLHCL